MTINTAKKRKNVNKQTYTKLRNDKHCIRYIYTNEESGFYGRKTSQISIMGGSNNPASPTEHLSTLRTLEATKRQSSIKIYLEAKRRINTAICSGQYFNHELISKAGKVPFPCALVLLLRQSNLVYLNLIGQQP